MGSTPGPPMPHNVVRTGKMTTSTLRRFGAVITALTVAAATLAFVSPATAAEPDDRAPVVVSGIDKNDGKGYLVVDGKPFTMIGVQNFGEWQTFGNQNDIKPDQSVRIIEQDWLENLFEKTKAAGFNTIQIMTTWNQIEPKTQGVYDWTLIDKYVAWAEKYDLRIDWVWFGAMSTSGGGILPNRLTNGQTQRGFMTNIPEYLWDVDKYWGRGTNGYEIMMPWVPTTNPSDPNYPHRADAEFLFKAERDAVAALFDHLADVDDTRRTIMYQIWNEPAGHVDWRRLNSTFLDLADQLGKVVKDSDYVVATRMNFAGWHMDPVNGDPDSKPHIDFYGPDPYTYSLATLGDIVRDTAKKSDVSYLAESYGNNTYATSVVATALANGGFVNFWQLNDSFAGSAFAMWGDPDPSKPDYLNWRVGTIPEKPEAVQRLSAFLPALRKMDEKVAVALPKNIATFNVENDVPLDTYSSQKQLGSTMISYQASDKSIGMAYQDGGAYYLVSDTRGTATFNTYLQGAEVSEGEFTAAGEWVEHSTLDVAADGSFTIGTQQLIRVTGGQPTFEFTNPATADTIAVAAAGTLPGTVKIGGTDTEVTWFDSLQNKARNPYATFTAQGYLTQADASGKHRLVNAPVISVPDNLEYFFDSGATATTSTHWAAVKALGTIRNDTWDRASASPSQAGYVNQNVAPYTTTQSNIWQNGLYANVASGPITYRFPLEKGTYRVNAGIHEWWETRTGREKIEYTIDGQTTTVNGKSWSLNSGGETTGDILFTLPAATTVSYTVMPGAGSTKASTISWVGVAATARPLGLQGSLTPTSALPETVTVDGQPRAVTWDQGSADLPRTLHGKVALSGSYDDAGRTARVQAEYEIVPDDLVYFIDSGVTAANTANATQWAAIKASTPGLLNGKPDQVSGAATQWGYVNATAGDTSVYGNGSNFDKWNTGLYADKKPSISYRLPLKAGTYTITAGIHEWWETRNMDASVTWTTSTGEVKKVPGDTIYIQKDQNLTGSVEFELSEDTTVTYTLDRSNLGKQAVISWLAVAGKADTAAPEVTLEVPEPAASGWHTTAPTVTVNATDASTIAAVEYRLGGGDWQAYTAPVALSDGEIVFEARARDAAGNQSDPVRADAKVDTVKPTVTLVGGPTGQVPAGSVPAAPTCTAADTGSGIADACTVTGYGTAAGEHTLTATVSDKAGNTATATRTYTVLAAPAWAASTVYNTGNQVTYNGSLWTASWWTQNQKPGDPNGPWQEITTAPDGTAVWTASRIFNTGDRVTHNGATYEAKWWTRNQKPGDPNGPWKRVN